MGFSLSEAVVVAVFRVKAPQITWLGVEGWIPRKLGDL